MKPPVPRETSPPPPAAAVRLFGPRLAHATCYAQLLAGDAVVRGLVGPREVPRIWERHLLNCAVVAPLVAPGSTVCDLGSGAGLPGLVLGLLRPDLEVTLLEPLLRRVTFLVEAVDQLGLGNVTVRRGRAEEVRSSFSVDVVTARAVAPLTRLARLAVPLCRPGGELLALKGSAAASEVRAAASTLDALGAAHWETVQMGIGVVDPPTTVIRVTTAAPPTAIRADPRR